MELWACLLQFSLSYSVHHSILQKITHDVGKESCRSASAQLNRLQGAEPDDVDVTVTCDGTWSCRGFVAAYGVAVVLSWETGQVLDVMVLSKSCKEAQCTMGSELQEFLDWMEKWKGPRFFGRGQWRRTSCGTWWLYPMGMLRRSHG